MRSIPDIAFSWDPDKALQNERKHGITFEEAATVFDDCLAVILPDPDDNTGEDRWIAIGLTNTRILALVAHLHTDGEGRAIIRIISARRATSHERRKYETSPYSIREAVPMKELKPEKPFEMREEYDIPDNVERGRFYVPNASHLFPIYLDRDVLKHFSQMARSRGIETRVLLNEILRRQMPGGDHYAAPPEPREHR
jgi:uncharacterized DUF497 family protein